MIIAIDRIIFNLYLLWFYSNENLADSGLTNFGKSLENLLALTSISLNFVWLLKKLISYSS